MVAPGLDPGFVGTETHTIWGVFFKKKNIKWGKNVNLYLEWEKESKQLHHNLEK